MVVPKAGKCDRLFCGNCKADAQCLPCPLQPLHLLLVYILVTQPADMPFLSVVGRSRPNTPASSRAPSHAPESSLPLPPLPLPSLPLPEPHHLTDDMPNPLEIIIPSDTIVLRGTGTHTEPTILSGSVVLNLPEAMALKSLSLVLRGKSRIAAPAGWDRCVSFRPCNWVDG